MQRPEGIVTWLHNQSLNPECKCSWRAPSPKKLFFAISAPEPQNDLERATQIARGMVMEYELSRMGRIQFPRRQPLGIPRIGWFGWLRVENTPSKHAREIDQEVKRLIDESIQRARTILTERRAALEALANKLIEVEVIESEELKRIIDATLPGPRVVPGTQVAGSAKIGISTNLGQHDRNRRERAQRAPRKRSLIRDFGLNAAAIPNKNNKDNKCHPTVIASTVPPTCQWGGAGRMRVRRFLLCLDR